MRSEPSVADATAYPAGLVFDVSFQEFSARLTVLSPDRLRFEIAIVATSIRPGLFLVSWVERSGATVVHVEDFAQGRIHSQATLADGTFLRMAGPLRVASTENEA